MPELEEAGMSAEPQFGFKLYVNQDSLLVYIHHSLNTQLSMLFFFGFCQYEHPNPYFHNRAFKYH